MLTTSRRTLKILAALTWYIGGVILALKGGSLLLEANKINPKQNWTWFAVICGILIGLTKAKYIFNKSCKNNLARVDLLNEPKARQFFRPGFFFF